MALPIKDDALEQIGPAQERALGGRRAADHDVAAAAGADATPIAHELFGAEPRCARVFVDALRNLNEFAPASGGVQVHFDHAGVGRHLDDIEARIVRRRVTFDMHGRGELRGRGFDRREDSDVIFKCADIRHEHAQPPVARLDGESGTRDALARGRRGRGIGQGR